MPTYNKKRVPEVDVLQCLGKIPPQAIDIEKAVLGALLIQSDAIYEVMGIISAETFYQNAHAEIFKAIISLRNKIKPIDILTVAQELKSTDSLDIIGGEIYLSELTDRVATSAHLESHAKIIQQKYIQRNLIKASAEIQMKGFDESIDVADLIQFAEQKIFEITDTGVKKDIQNTTTLITDSMDRLKQRAKSDFKFNGVPSGFTSLDRITSGFQCSDLIVLAARPSMGKTSLALNIARNIAIDYKMPTAVFSLEMSANQLSDRLIVSESGINSDKFRTGKLSEWEWSKIESCASILQSDNLIIDDTSAISIFELRSKCRKIKRDIGLKCIVVDYLQLMTAGIDATSKGNREQEVSFISRSLKAIAKELNVPVIALSQLNRAVESRSGNKRPQLSDLRESGAIEQDADMVMFIHRPEYYGILENEKGESLKEIAEIIIAKYRNGSTGIIDLKFNDSIVKFSDKSNNEDIAEFSKPDNNSDIPTNTDFESSPF